MKFALSASCIVIGAMTASATLSPFPYDATLNTRYSIGSAEVASFDSPLMVPAVSGGMQVGESIAVIESDVLDFCATDAENWTMGTTAIGTPQAAFSMKFVDGSCKWMGYVANAGWVEFSGVTAVEGDWKVKIEIDYSVPGARLVRYSVKAADASDYTALTYDGQTWLPLAGSSTTVSSLKFYGFGEINGAIGQCGVRPIEATVETAEAVSMNYDSLDVDVNVKENWGVDAVTVVLKDAQGAQVASKAVQLADGKGTANFTELTAGSSYSYDVNVSGSGQTRTVGESEEVDLFAQVDWFGFRNGAFEKSTGTGVSIVDNAFKATSGIGTVNPATASSEDAETVFEGRLVVNGAYQLGNQFEGEEGTKSIPSVTGQFAITLARKAGADVTQVGDRTWVVWKNGAWTPVSFVATENGSYDVKVTVDYKTGAGTYYLKTAAAQTYTQVETFTVSAKKLTDAAVVGGSVSALNASFKSVKPIEVLPTGSAISLAANAEVDLAKLASGDYAVRNETKTTYHLRWKDDASDGGKFAKMENGTLAVKSGQPANGMDSFTSHVLGLDPTVATDKPYLASEQVAETDKIQLTMPNVTPRDVSETGVTVSYQLKASDNPTTFSGEPIATASEPTFKVGVPSSGEKVKYYKVDIKLAD